MDGNPSFELLNFSYGKKFTRTDTLLNLFNVSQFDHSYGAQCKSMPLNFIQNPATNLTRKLTSHINLAILQLHYNIAIIPSSAKKPVLTMQ